MSIIVTGNNDSITILGVHTKKECGSVVLLCFDGYDEQVESYVGVIGDSTHTVTVINISDSIG